MQQQMIQFIKRQFPNQKFISLYEIRFFGNEKEWIMEALLESTVFSPVGRSGEQFEQMAVTKTQAKYADADFYILGCNYTKKAHPENINQLVQDKLFLNIEIVVNAVLQKSKIGYGSK